MYSLSTVKGAVSSFALIGAIPVLPTALVSTLNFRPTLCKFSLDEATQGEPLQDRNYLLADDSSKWNRNSTVANTFLTLQNAGGSPRSLGTGCMQHLFLNAQASAAASSFCRIATSPNVLKFHIMHLTYKDFCSLFNGREREIYIRT